MKKKYPWEKLKKVGDTFIVDVDAVNLRSVALHWGKRYNMKIKVHKIKGGAIALRVA